eukprot:2952196-Prymnesium_polylepis.2
MADDTDGTEEKVINSTNGMAWRSPRPTARPRPCLAISKSTPSPRARAMATKAAGKTAGWDNKSGPVEANEIEPIGPVSKAGRELRTVYRVEHTDDLVISKQHFQLGQRPQVPDGAHNGARLEGERDESSRQALRVSVHHPADGKEAGSSGKDPKERQDARRCPRAFLAAAGVVVLAFGRADATERP